MRELVRISIIVLASICLMSSFSQAASIDIIQKGISGSITSDIGLDSLNNSAEADDYIFFGTQLGIYVLSSDGELVNFIQTGSSVMFIKTIPDFNDNNYDELVFTTTNYYFPNVLCYDSLTGEKLWDFSSKTEVFDVDMLWTMKQVTAYGLEVSTSGDKVYLTAGYNVYCLNSETGEQLAIFEGTDNMWDIALVDDDVIVGDQNGYIYRFNGNTLSQIWSTFVSKSYTVVNPDTKETRGTVKRSVWDIVPITVDNQKRIIASCEDGFIYILNFDNGEILRSTKIIDYVDYYLYEYYQDNPQPTSFMDYNFFNLRIIKLPDVTDDENPDILVYTYPGRRSGEYKPAKQGLYLIDSSNGQIKKEKESIDLNYVNKLVTVKIPDKNNNTYIFIPQGKSGSVEEIDVFYPDSLTKYKTIEVNSSAGAAGINVYAIKDLGNNDLCIVSNYCDVFKSDFYGNVSWNYPRLNSIKVERINLVGSSDTDLFVKSVEGTNDDSFLAKYQSRMIFVIDGGTKKISWSYEMPYDEFVLTGGFQGVKTVPDVNNDSINDIVAYKQRSYDWGSGDMYGENTTIVVFSGKTGEIIYEKPVISSTYYGTWEDFFADPLILGQYGEEWVSNEKENRRIRKIITSLDVVGDVSGDGVSDFVVGSWYDVYIFDSVKGEPIWTRTYNSWVYEDISGHNSMENYLWEWPENERLLYFSLDDINSDGVNELLQASWDEMWILYSSINSQGRLDYSVYSTFTKSADEHIDTEQIQIIDDVNGDTFSDIIFQVNTGDSSNYRILSGKNFEKIMEFNRDGTTVSLSEGDLNADGYDDSFIFYAYEPRLEVRNGKNDEVMWIYFDYDDTWTLREIFGVRDLMPVCIIDDINGDGSNDLAVGKSLPWDRGAYLEIYDAKNNRLIKSITVEAQDQSDGHGDIRWQPSIINAKLSDLTGDGVSEVAVVMALGESNQKQLKLVIIDVVKEEIISDFTAKGTDIEAIGELIITYGTGGELYLLNPVNNLNITSPENNKIVGSPMKISWEEGSDETVKIIMVDDNRIMQTSNNEAEFELKKGDRKITVYSFDKYGKGLYDSVYVNVEKESASELPMTVAVIVLLLVLFLPKVIPKVLKKGSSMKKPKKKKTEEEDEE